MKEQKKDKAKKGLVINRRNNRTVDTSRAQHDPKWECLMDSKDHYTGIRVLKGKDKPSFIGWKNGVMSSLSGGEVAVRLMTSLATQ